MILHRLEGCAPVPLAHYLKAIGILRLVSQQADPEARGWWEGERFLLATHLDEDELLDFFLKRYAPTPLVAPWNKGSGFFYANDPGLAPVEHSIAPRFETLREGIRESRTLLGELSLADKAIRDIKAETKRKDLTKTQRDRLRRNDAYKKRLADAERRFKQLKSDFIPRLRLTWRGPHREWMDAAMVLDDSGEPQFPALLGTGGNDGRLDFTNNFFQNLNNIFDLRSTMGDGRPEAMGWFRNALFSTPVNTYRSGAVGQYAPGAAGGANSTTSVDGDSLLNPVDFLLTLEGAVLFTAHATRRLGTTVQSRAAAPFAIGGHASGYASAANSDESARGEQWMPLWSQPTTLPELERVLAEGRAQIGTKPVNQAIDMARAVANLGTARGIKAFQRYGYIERNGQSNLAVPLGRFRVANSVSPRLACLDDLDAWLTRLHRAARDKGAPNRLKMAERRLSDALFSVIRHPDHSSRWQALVQALADVEAILITSPNLRCGPIPSLRPEWVSATNDGSTEWRLAVSLALQGSGSQREHKSACDVVRRHWVPEKHQETAAVMKGANSVDDAIALVKRRLVEARQIGLRRLPLTAAHKADASLADLTALLTGQVDIDRTLSMARVLMAVKGREWAQRPQFIQSPSTNLWPDEGWLAIRLAMLPWPLPSGRSIGSDPAILRRLESGDATTATDLALRRLQAAGVVTTVRFSMVPPETARLWAAALAFPIHRRTAERMLQRLDPLASPE